MNFSDLDLPFEVKQGIELAGFTTGTPVQEAVIPRAIRGEDAVSCGRMPASSARCEAPPSLTRPRRSVGVRLQPKCHGSGGKHL